MLIGNKDSFAIEYRIISKEEKISELYFFINGENILEFKDKDNTDEVLTTTWNITDLLNYIATFTDSDHAKEPYPVKIDAASAAEIDSIARDFDSDDEDVLEEYYTKINDWAYEHTWDHCRCGAIVAPVHFRVINDSLEISWDNADDVYNNIEFIHKKGSYLIPKNEFNGICTSIEHSYLTEMNSTD